MFVSLSNGRRPFEVERRNRRNRRIGGRSDSICGDSLAWVGTMGAMSGEKGRRGRVEAGLERELVDRRDVRPAERAALRAQARAVDVAEAARDPDAVSRSNAVYLDLREKAGLTHGASGAGGDPIDALLAELARPGAGASDLPNS